MQTKLTYLATLLVMVSFAGLWSGLATSGEHGAGRLFEAIELTDDGAHAHVHGGIALRGDRNAVLVYFRVKGSYQNAAGQTVSDQGPVERAKRVARALRQATKAGHASCSEVKLYNGRQIYIGNPVNPSDHSHHVVKVLNGDVTGYRNRANLTGSAPKNAITADVVARWWLANIKDQLCLFADGKLPTETVGHGPGKVYLDLHSKAQKKYGTAKIDPDQWKAVIGELSDAQRKDLRNVGRLIPKNFVGTQAHRGH